MAESLPDAPALQTELDQLGLATSPWELQGALIGWIAGGGDADGGWLGKVMADPALPALTDGSAIDRLGRGIQARMEDNDFDLALLLPGDDASLQVRSAALFDWCRHFLGAFKGALPGHYRYNQRMYAHFMQDDLPPEQRGIFLAGDDVSWTPAWVEGAVQTSLNAV